LDKIRCGGKTILSVVFPGSHSFIDRALSGVGPSHPLARYFILGGYLLISPIIVAPYSSLATSFCWADGIQLPRRSHYRIAFNFLLSAADTRDSLIIRLTSDEPPIISATGH
jgi:hypothetical protein